MTREHYVKHWILYEHFVAQVVPKAFPKVQLMVPCMIKSGKRKILITILPIRQPYGNNWISYYL